MAFDSTIVVLRKKYDPAMLHTVLTATNSILSQFGIKVDKTVATKEYEQMTSSKEINRYIRIKKVDLQNQKKEATDLIKVGTSRIQAFERFASAKYAFFSISNLEDDIHTVLWFSFHSRISNAFPEFRDFSYQAARQLSIILSTEGYALEASSLSRNSDRFVLYVNGKERHKLSTKGALTEVKKLYGLDINALMINVDKNMAIHYAPSDHRELTHELKQREVEYNKWKLHRNEIQIKNQEDGTNMIDSFEKENDVFMESLHSRLSVVEQALRSDPIGSIVYFKMTDLGGTRTYISENERLFGREVRDGAKVNV